jgi:hypothetical protein
MLSRKKIPLRGIAMSIHRPMVLRKPLNSRARTLSSASTNYPPASRLHN